MQASFDAINQFLNIIFGNNGGLGGGLGAGPGGGPGGATGYADEAMAFAPKRTQAARDAYAAIMPGTGRDPNSFNGRWNAWAASGYRSSP